jgi:hypothetical protein
MEICKICQKEFSNLYSLRNHIFKSHNLKSKEYYDLHLLKEKSNCCLICNNTTSFRNIRVGYLKHCSTQCRDKNKDIKHNYWLGKKQSKHTIEKRIKNTNQIVKELNRKNSLLLKYGHDNPSQIPASRIKISISCKNKKKPRTKEWQQKIIDSKRKNGTLNHTDETKEKLKKSINKYHQNNTDRQKFIPFLSNKKSISGWYKNIFFRSSLELSFLYHNKNKVLDSCEKNEFKVIYELDGKIKTYYPDFTDGEFIYEIKPHSLLNQKNNIAKFISAKEEYGLKFKVITEKDIPYLNKDKIYELLNSNEIILTKTGVSSLSKYRIK